jgi:hypothetical protein
MSLGVLDFHLSGLRLIQALRTNPFVNRAAQKVGFPSTG